MKKNMFILSISILLYSCQGSFTEAEVVGTYVPIGYKNSYDTIKLLQGGIFQRRVYDLKGRQLLNMTSRYELRQKGRQVYFDPFFLNLDSNLIKFPELASDTLGSGLFNLEKHNGRIEFCTGYHSASLANQNCYQKR